MQKACGLPLLFSFSGLPWVPGFLSPPVSSSFHSSSEVLFNFPSQYSSLSIILFSWHEEGSPLLNRSRFLAFCFVLTGLSPSSVDFSKSFVQCFFYTFSLAATRVFSFDCFFVTLMVQFTFPFSYFSICRTLIFYLALSDHFRLLHVLIL